MAKFRKRPVVIEAVKVLDIIRAHNDDFPKLVPIWIIAAYGEGTLDVNATSVDVRTLEGTMTGELDDWIIQGVKGELYPCKPDIFEATYEKMED